MEEYNTIIIGSGIAGMSAAIYLRRAGIKTMIIESNMPGGQLNYASTIAVSYTHLTLPTI